MTRRVAAVSLVALAIVPVARSLNASATSRDEKAAVVLHGPQRPGQGSSERRAIATPGGATPTPNGLNQIEVRLAPGLGNEWCVYNGQLGDADHNRVGVATISGITNTTDKRIVLIHWDSAGGREGPVSLNVRGATDAFNGMSVTGVWEAHVAGSEVDAPQRVTILVGFSHA